MNQRAITERASVDSLPDGSTRGSLSYIVARDDPALADARTLVIVTGACALHVFDHVFPTQFTGNSWRQGLAGSWPALEELGEQYQLLMGMRTRRNLLKNAPDPQNPSPEPAISKARVKK